MGTDMRVLVLAGGLSYERDVSLRSGRRVLDAQILAGAARVVVARVDRQRHRHELDRRPLLRRRRAADAGVRRRDQAREQLIEGAEAIWVRTIYGTTAAVDQMPATS